MPENVHIFKHSDFRHVERDDLIVYGAGFTDPNVFRPLLSGLTFRRKAVHPAGKSENRRSWYFTVI
jgi:hypothetical protein